MNVDTKEIRMISADEVADLNRIAGKLLLTPLAEATIEGRPPTVAPLSRRERRANERAQMKLARRGGSPRMDDQETTVHNDDDTSAEYKAAKLRRDKAVADLKELECAASVVVSSREALLSLGLSEEQVGALVLPANVIIYGADYDDPANVEARRLRALAKLEEEIVRDAPDECEQSEWERRLRSQA